MTERYWTPERKKHYYKLAEKEELQRKYMREYMRGARKQGKIIHWREYKKMKERKNKNGEKKKKEKENYPTRTVNVL
tara:strand:+ start:243 stop:473 length:231 start_codon:yes stop_codon:yes gene_type:complete